MILHPRLWDNEKNQNAVSFSTEFGVEWLPPVKTTHPYPVIPVSPHPPPALIILFPLFSQPCKQNKVVVYAVSNNSFSFFRAEKRWDKGERQTGLISCAGKRGGKVDLPSPESFFFHPRFAFQVFLHGCRFPKKIPSDGKTHFT